MCVVLIKAFWLDVRYPQQATVPERITTRLPKHQNLSRNHQFSERIWYAEYYSVYEHMAWNQKYRLTPGRSCSHTKSRSKRHLVLGSAEFYSSVFSTMSLIVGLRHFSRSICLYWIKALHFRLLDVAVLLAIDAVSTFLASSVEHRTDPHMLTNSVLVIRDWQFLADG